MDVTENETPKNALLKTPPLVLELLPSITREEDEAIQLAAWRDRAVLSAAQLVGALALSEIIDFQEARLFGRTGELPEVLLTSIEAALKGLPEHEKQLALVKVESATEYQRVSPLTPILGARLNMDDLALDALWRIGATL